MKHFWHGFQKKTAQAVSFKKHVIVLFWKPDQKDGDLDALTRRVSLKHPTVKFKTINVNKYPATSLKHSIRLLPTVLLMKDGREVDRLERATGLSVLDALFRKATT